MNSNDGFKIADAQTLVFIGDSITDCGRRQDAPPLGRGYVKLASDLITARYPQRRITFHNRGISGNVVTDLLDRWDRDVIALEPDWVSVMIGINDANRRFRENPDEHVPQEMYRRGYEQFLTRTAERTGARLVLMDPFYITTDADPQSDRGVIFRAINDYIAVVREVARRFDAVRVPMHDVFQRHLEHRPADAFCPEPVHPNRTGHMVIAHAWLRAMGW